MEVGAIEESVTVVGDSPLLQTDRADTSRIIESVHLAEVPLGFNRNFQGMMVTVPGALRMQRPHSGLLQRPGQPVGERQRPVAPREQRPDRRHRRQPPHRPADDADSLGGSDRRGTSARAPTTRSSAVRAARSRPERHAQIGHERLKGSVFVFGNNEKTNAPGYLLTHGAAGRLPAERFHGRHRAQWHTADQVHVAYLVEHVAHPGQSGVARHRNRYTMSWSSSGRRHTNACTNRACSRTTSQQSPAAPRPGQRHEDWPGPRCWCSTSMPANATATTARRAA